MSSKRYHRAGIIDLAIGLEKIIEFQDKEHRYKVNIQGYRLNVSSNRLKTFIQSQTCPCCKVKASFFAIEKQYNKYLQQPDSKKGYHINLYGYDKENKEVLFTHDHTLARGLGGEDKLYNTVTMCSPCNGHKGQLESRIKTTKSSLYKEVLEKEIQHFLETGIKHTPAHPEPEIDQKPDSKSYLKKLALKELKRIYKKYVKDKNSLTPNEEQILQQHQEKREIENEYKSRKHEPSRARKF